MVRARLLGTQTNRWNSTFAGTMRLMPVVLLTVLGAGVLFYVGSSLGKWAVSGLGRGWLLLTSIVLAAPGLIFAFYYTHLFDNAAWLYSFRVLPFTDFLPAGIGLLAGVLNSWFEPESLGEKLVAPTALAVLVLVPFVKPLLDPIELDRLQGHCEGEVCMQSTFSSCGPSSAATLLKAFVQVASEKQLAKECLTSRGGTEVWYIARAFNRCGFRTQVRIQSQGSLSPPSPAIAGVVLPGGAGHFVAILNETPTEVTIADPMKGKLVVKRVDLKSYYHFTGFFLVIHPN
jgi:peptidase C39-like protein